MRWRRRAGRLGGVAIAVAAISACGIQSSAAQVLATVNGRPVTESSWRTAIRATAVVAGTQLRDRGRARPAQVQALVRQQVVVDYALSHHWVNWTQASSEASSYVEHSMALGNRGQFLRLLRRNQITDSAFVGYVAHQMILNDAFVRVTRDLPQASNAQVSAYYASHPQQFTTPSTVEVRQILVKTREQAGALLDQIRHGASFAALAERYSLDASSARAGGSLGFIERGRASGLLPHFYETMDSLRPGQYGIANTRLGYHIIEVQAVKTGSVASLSQVRPSIVAELTNAEKASKFDAWAKQIESAVKVKIL